MKKSVMLLIAVVIIVALAAGCYSEEEAAYREKVSELSERSDRVNEEFIAWTEDSTNRANSMSENSSQEDWNAFLDEAIAKFTVQLNESRAIQSEMAALNPPKRFETAHAQYNAGMMQVVMSFETMTNSLADMRNNMTLYNAQAVITSADNSLKFADEAEENFNEANDDVFGFPYEILIGGIVAALISFGLIGFAIVMMSRRRRQPALAAPYQQATCPWCGWQVPPDSPYCPKCGRLVS